MQQNPIIYNRDLDFNWLQKELPKNLVRIDLDRNQEDRCLQGFEKAIEYSLFSKNLLLTILSSYSIFICFLNWYSWHLTSSSIQWYQCILLFFLPLITTFLCEKYLEYFQELSMLVEAKSILNLILN